MKINLKLIGRNLITGKSYPVLNIIGMAIGFACVFVVIVWLKNEFSYDKGFTNSARTYRLTFETNFSGNRLHFARCWERWISQIPASFPQIEELVRLEPFRHTALKIGENKLYSEKVFATDSNFFKVFGIELFSGDSENVLKEPYSVVISSSMAKKCFGSANPVGQILSMSGEYDTKMTNYTITGIMEDTPANSHIHFDILTSFVRPQEPPAWAYVYFLLRPGTKPQEIVEGFSSFIKLVESEQYQNAFIPHLQKITDIHLFSDKDREIEQNGNITSIYLFIVVALVIILITWVNNYNLNKARLLTLQKQIHIQRITGSNNLLITIQSILESLVCTGSAFILALIILDLVGRAANSLIGISLLPNGSEGLVAIWHFLLLILVSTVLVGSLPVIQYVHNGGTSLKGFKEIPIKAFPRLTYGILMTIQFCFSIILMVAAITINHQKEYIFSRSLGKMDSDILVFKRQNWEIRGKYNSFRDRALQNPYIKSVTASMEEPSGETLDALRVESTAIDDDHKNNPVYVLSVEDNFLTFFDIQLVAGRNFSQYNAERKAEDYILNETALKQFGWTAEEAIGKPFRIQFGVPDIFYGGTVVGVAKDFNLSTIKQAIKPYALFQKPIFYLCFLVKVDAVHKQEAIAHLKSVWEQELPDYPFQFESVSDLYKSVYQKELTQSRLTSLFSFMAIIIIFFGLISVTSVLVARRTKEIGIRKVNGARVSNIIIVLTTDYLLCFAVAFIIACPVAWFAMHKWLQNFVYRTEQKWWAFAAAGLVVLTVTLITVTLKSMRTARRNPVEALRYE